MIRNLSTFLLVLGFSFIISFYYPHVTVAPGNVKDYHKKYENQCTTCHKPFSGVLNSSCTVCHETFDKKKVYKSTKPYPVEINLDGLHRDLGNTSCYKCHPEHASAVERQTEKFKHDLKQIRDKCVNCHNKPENEVHENTKNCKSCHSTKTWKGARFVHPVRGTNCESCHKKPLDSFHKSFDKGCSSCHDTKSWRNADFDHSKFFKLSGPHKAKCTTCHELGVYTTYTCYGCHEHSESKVMRKHQKMGVSIEDCTDCHCDASEKNAKRKLREIWGKSDSTTKATPAKKRKRNKHRNDHEEDEDDNDDD
jgi:hypothetical protein